MSNYQVVDLKRHLRNISDMLRGCHCNLEQRCINVNWFSIYGRCQVLFIMKFRKLKLAKGATSRALFSPAGPELWISLTASHRCGLILSQAQKVSRVNRISSMNGLHFPDIPRPNMGECSPPPLSPCVLSNTPLNIFPLLSISLSLPLSLMWLVQIMRQWRSSVLVSPCKHGAARSSKDLLNYWHLIGGAFVPGRSSNAIRRPGRHHGS